LVHIPAPAARPARVVVQAMLAAAQQRKVFVALNQTAEIEAGMAEKN
jgi:hypothetical protein